MKAIKIIALSMLCALAFSSCQRNYSELIVGTWQVDKSVSYRICNGKRIYSDDVRENDRKTILIAFYEDGQYKTSDGEVARYHIDGDYIYNNGEGLKIIKLNNKRMVLESGDSHGDYYHVELDRTRWDIDVAVEEYDYQSLVQEGNARLGDPAEAAMQTVQMLNQLSNQPQIETLSFKEQSQTQPLSMPNTQPSLRWLGRVDLYYLDENNEIEKYDYFPTPSGNDIGLYLNQTNGIESYELHMGSAIYHVANGIFQISANNGYFEFSAHAGKYYFDI